MCSLYVESIDVGEAEPRTIGKLEHGTQTHESGFKCSLFAACISYFMMQERRSLNWWYRDAWLAAAESCELELSCYPSVDTAH